MAEGSFERLPKWAQEKIVNLQRALSDKEREIAALTGETPANAAYVLLGASTSNDFMPFPRGTEVQFVLTPKTHQMHRPDTVDASVLTDRQGFRYLRLLGDRPIAITPVSSNGIEIRLQ